MKQFHYIILTFFFIISCNNNDLQQVNSEKTKELISQILADSTDTYSSPSCITEKFRFHHTIPPGVNFEDYAKRELEIEDLKHLETQFQYFRNFKIDENLAKGKNIITANEFENFEKEAERGDFQFWDWLDQTCDDGYVSISRPLFNEDFTKALVIIANVSCPQCGGGETRMYELQSGKWEIVETSNGWIS
jgi:hypothetical protein